VSEPIRRCVGCGRVAPQRELVRFVAADGRLVRGARQQGRGAYTCRSGDCFEQAVARRGFQQALRQGVSIDPALVRLYTEDSDGERR
jgi:uncharacterized protein